MDKAFYGKTTYYRLLETDINGHEKIVSDIISLDRNEGTSIWTFYPNPVKDILSIETNQMSDRTTSLSIYNSLGVLIKQKEISLEKGENQLLLDMTNYPSGVYFLSIDKGAIIEKIIR